MVQRIEHAGTAAAAKITADLTNSGTIISGNNLTGWPTGGIGPFYVAIDRGLVTEEHILCVSRSGNTLTVASGGRGVDGTSAVAHTANATLEHIFTATEADEANAHIMATNAHGVTGNVVGTGGAQVLTSKTIDGGANTLQNIAYASIPGLASDLTARPTSSTVATAIDVASPIGSIVMWPAAVAPAEWAICDGTALSTAAYPELFAAIGYVYGGSGGTFNLPDLRNKQVMGAIAGTRPLASTGGAETHTLTINNIPQHSHAIDHDHASFNTSDGAGAHTHSIATKTGTTSTTTGAPQEVSGGTASTVNSASAGGHNHAIDVPAHTGTSGNAGQASPTAVNHLDPYLSLNFIINKGRV